MRRLLIALALIAALAIPSSALAATSSGNTAETIDNAATISLTVPSTLTYVVDSGSTWKGTWLLSGYTTNNPTGSNIKAVFSAFTCTPSCASLPVTNRTLTFTSTCSSTWNTANPMLAAHGTPPGFTIHSDSGPITNQSCSYTPRVTNVAVGTYSGTIAVTATTN